MKGALSSVFAALLAATALGGTVKELDLAKGYSSYNTISEAVYAPPAGFSLAVGSLEAAYDRNGEILRRLSKGMFTRGVKADVDPSIDLAALLAQAIRAEAATMGLPAGDDGATFRLGGQLHDVFLESKQIPYGATLFYGFMDVTLRVERRGGASRELRFRLHNNFAGWNLGFSRKDEAADALMRFLVESAQEIVARLNREVFHAPPTPALVAKRQTIAGAAELPREVVRLVGLSGDQEAVPVLLAALPARKSVLDRVEIIVALANLGLPAAVEPLAARYDKEDEDCRFATLKAFDYIGGERALALAREKGSADEDNACRSLAGRIAP